MSIIKASCKELNEIDLNKINADNIFYYDNLIKNNGCVSVLSTLGYINFLDEFDVPYDIE